MPPNLSVIVPTCQRRIWAERLLRALSQQTLAPQAYEVIIMIDGETGLLVPPADPALACRRAAAGQLRVERDFSAASMIQQVAALCAELSTRRGESHDRAR